VGADAAQSRQPVGSQQSLHADGRTIVRRHVAVGGARGGECAGRQLADAVSGHLRRRDHDHGHRDARGLDHRPHPALPDRAPRCRGLRSAHRLRQHRQPLPRARRVAAQGSRHPIGTRRQPPATLRPAAQREHSLRDHRGRPRRRPRVGGATRPGGERASVHSAPRGRPPRWDGPAVQCPARARDRDALRALPLAAYRAKPAGELAARARQAVRDCGARS
jgi:hypothetical protein